jgi:hypothetical protein
MKGGPVKRNVSNVANIGSQSSTQIPKSRQCLESDSNGKLFSTTIKKVNLDGWVNYCDGVIADTRLEKTEHTKGLAKECKGGR